MVAYNRNIRGTDESLLVRPLLFISVIFRMLKNKNKNIAHLAPRKLL